MLLLQPAKHPCLGCGRRNPEAVTALPGCQSWSVGWSSCECSAGHASLADRLGTLCRAPQTRCCGLCGHSPAADPPSQLWGSLQHSHSSVPIWEVESHYSTVLSRVGLRCSPGLPSGTEAFFSIWRCLRITRTQCQTHFQGVSHSLTIPQVMLPPWGHFTRFKLLTAHPHLLPGPDCPA